MAESFGVDPEMYDRSRPAYPDELIARVMATSSGRQVLDVGCGTGIVARQFEAAGCAVLGVDPDTRLAAFARRGGTDVEVATFEAWEPHGRVFDAVVAGQAWHWVHPIDGATKAAQILRPGGRLAVFGHAFGAPPEIEAAFIEAFRRVAPDSPMYQRLTTEAQPTPADRYEAMFAAAADGIRQAGGFDSPEVWRFEAMRTYSRAAWVNHLRTTGALTHLATDQREAIVRHVAAAIDENGGAFTVPLTTLAATAARTAA